MNPSNSSNLVNPFGTDSSNSAAPLTNPSPFKLFKSQAPTASSISNVPPSQPISSIPSSTVFSHPFSSAPAFPQNQNPNFPAASLTSPAAPSNPSNSAASNSKPGTAQYLSPGTIPTNSNIPNTASALFSSNKDLEDKKNQLLNKKRIQDVIDEWKKDISTNLQVFHGLADKVDASERSLKDVQKEVVLLQEYAFKIKAEQKRIEENIDLILAEQIDLNGALDVMDREIDKVLQSTGLYIGFEDKENIYKSCSIVSKNIDSAEDMFSRVLKQVSQKCDDDEAQDIEHTIDIFFETLDWIEKTVESVTERVMEIEKKYKYFGY